MQLRVGVTELELAGEHERDVGVACAHGAFGSFEQNQLVARSVRSAGRPCRALGPAAALTTLGARSAGWRSRRGGSRCAADGRRSSGAGWRLVGPCSRPLRSAAAAPGWRRVREVMEAAGIKGPHATPKGLRHGFRVHALMKDVPLAPVQRWMGHADLETTTIYLQVVGNEEASFAGRLWAD